MVTLIARGSSLCVLNNPQIAQDISNLGSLAPKARNGLSPLAKRKLRFCQLPHQTEHMKLPYSIGLSSSVLSYLTDNWVSDWSRSQFNLEMPGIESDHLHAKRMLNQ